MALLPKELQDIRKRLEMAERPLVFFDDDADGLTSYLLCHACNDRAIGIRAARGPMLTLDFVRKVEENIPDLILILDKPLVDKEFFDAVRTPTIWVDHHGLEAQEPHTWKVQNLTYYNPLLHNIRDSRPVSYWMWRAFRKKLWLGAVGTLSDWDSSLLAKFREEYPKLASKNDDVQRALYGSKIGELARIFNFLLKGRNADIVKAIRTLKHIEHPDELLRQTTARGRFLYKQYLPIKKEYDKQLEEALETRVKDSLYVHIFSYVSISLVTEVANELLTRKNADIIIVGRRDGGRVKFSMRSHTKNLPEILQSALVGVEGYGGGHKEACGGSVAEEHWEEFLRRITKL